MELQYTPYSLPLVLSALGSVLLAVYVLRSRATPGAVPFALLMLAVAEWTACYSLQMASVSLAAKVIFSRLLYIGVVSTPGLLLLFALRYTGRLERLRWRLGLLLAIEPLITLLLAWTGDGHTLLRTLSLDASGDFSVLVIDYGPWFWVHAAYSYALLLAGTLMLAQVALHSRLLYRRQARSVLVGVLAPWLGNALYLSGRSPFPHLDLTPFAFIILGGAVAWGLFRYSLLDILPIARDSVVEDMRDGLMVLSDDGRIVDLNPAALSILRCSPENTVGMPAAEVLSGFQPLAAALQCGGDSDSELTLRQDEDRQVFEVRISPLHDHQRLVGRLVFLHDVTARKQAEEEMVRSERLRAVGELSLGISHNLNNILTGVTGPAGLINFLTDDARIREETDLIISSAGRASDLVRRLRRTVHRSGGDSMEAICVADAVHEAVDATRPRWKDEAELHGITIDVTVEIEEVPPVAATQTGLHDVLINLLFNAVDALPEGGRIEISVTAAEKEVIVKITDDGIGMDAHVRGRVFEPFFTTKMNVGTGLGLSTAYATVGQWGGHMSLASTPGKGTTFTIGLPTWSGPRQTESLGPETPEPSQTVVDDSRQARILVVDDDPAVRLVLGRMLRTCGQQCHLVASGPEALASFERDRYEMAFVDLSMPEMAGDEVARRLRECDPHLVTVLITGWSLAADDPRLAHFDLTAGKPFGVNRIRRLLTEALDRREDRLRED